METIKKEKKKTPIQIGLLGIQIFENDEKSAFLREQAKRIRWIFEDLLKEERSQFIDFYNKGGFDMTLDETKAEQKFNDLYEDYHIEKDEQIKTI